MTDAELRTLAEKATRGQWQVIETKHLWHLPARPVVGIPAFEGETFPERSGEHTERRIFTVWNDPQAKSPYPVVTGSIGVGMDDSAPIHMTEISADNAAFIAAANPSAILDLLARITALEAENKRLRNAGQSALDYLVLSYNEGWVEGHRSGEIISELDAALSEKDQCNDQ